ncbi:MAG: type II secretion system major pseudopilin GspG [Phycisphaeraceae bacterium]|nr:type II secretion system major pseudopilin GspG [Phycisphaeraceae bacterium]
MPDCRARRCRGFSLIEIMVVVVIMGMLAGAVAVGVNQYMDTAKINRAKSDIATIVDAVEAYKLTKGRYPTSNEGLEPLPLKNDLDPWGRAYGYNNPGQSEPFEVFTLGADGRDGGEGIEADIYSWQLGEMEEVTE